MSKAIRNQLAAAHKVLSRRSANTSDAAERKAIDAALVVISSCTDKLAGANQLDKAVLAARASDALERAVAAARKGPFDNYLQDAQNLIASFQELMAEQLISERLPPAAMPAKEELKALNAARQAKTRSAAPVAPRPGARSGPVMGTMGVTDGIPTPINSRKFEDLRDEYAAFFDRCRLRPESAGSAEFSISRVIKFKATYQQVGTSLGIPWAFIGVIHGLEGGFNFNTHLHNGDPLTGRTVQVPAGRPAGQPPFTWLESARDALIFKKLNLITDWNLPRMLYQLEAYNGFGYRPIGIPTPYLWSFSNLYKSGKFVRDRVFDPNAVSKQCGAALVLRVLQERGHM